MKQYPIIFCLSFLSNLAFTQNVDSVIQQRQIVGVWQAGGAMVGDALRENFQFFTDGKFIFNFSQYDDAQRVLALEGHYRLSGHLLFMNVEARDEITGGYFTKGSPGFQRDLFVLEGGKVKTVIQTDSAGLKDPFIVKICQISKSGKIVGIQIDNCKYFKLSEDPHAFHKSKSGH